MVTQSASHVATATKALTLARKRWRATDDRWALLRRTALGIAKAWDSAERTGDATPAAVAALAGRYVQVLELIEDGCTPAPAEDGDGGEGWEGFAARQRQVRSEMGAGADKGR